MASVERGSQKVIPLLKDISPPKREALFIQKLEICSTVYRFDGEGAASAGGMTATINSADARGKELKRETLMELLDFINAPVSGENFLVKRLFVRYFRLFCVVFPPICWIDWGC